MTQFNKRDFLRFAGAGTLLTAASGHASQTAAATPACADPFAGLKSMTVGVEGITLAERQSRIAKAQRLMAENGIDAMYLDSGTGLEYFTGVSWGRSERMLAAIIPVEGGVTYVSPGFEEERLRELMTIGDDVRTWEEHDSPYERVAQILDDVGASKGTVAIEERVRFFLFDGIRKQRPNATYVSADPVTIPSRLYKSKDEIRLMQLANDITIECYKTVIPMLEEGMSPQDFINLTAKVMDGLGAPGGRIWCSFGEATAFPHGSMEPQTLKKGDVVLMDGGCGVKGYRADISRTTVFGEATARQTTIWNLEQQAQQAGFDAAKIGSPCENVDIAARKVLVDAGFGPNYKVPGLPHRTGHGIGMDGHEWGNMVLGNKTPLDVGMCFSVEPMIAIYGEFGIRLEDCAYMTAEGPKWFSQPSVAVDQPV
ncbi:M24 family metallopeptidase [Congregibacter sp.]|jgi:Xaa-Pro dipeptidase|uniref:M24 family metallopeptidase n=1 Tax=Congregibacter sp. TaxID=2744308 RepID=UPI0039E2B948